MHLNMEQAYFMHYVVEVGHIFNWAQILFFNIFETVRKAQRLKKLDFYMSSYLIGVICLSIHFPTMGWDWKPNLSPMHILF